MSKSKGFHFMYNTMILGEHHGIKELSLSTSQDLSSDLVRISSEYDLEEERKSP